MAYIARPIVVGLGEVLWDLLPEGKRAGGAPANFAYHAAALGARGFVVSSVGDDLLGSELIETLDSLGVNCDFVVVDLSHPTGTVSVTLDDRGDAHYAIHENVAWDHIPHDAELALAAKADAICVGTLAQRATVSRESIHRFLDSIRPQCVRVLDVNLRQPGHEGFIAATLAKCNVVKLNESEWPIVARTLDLPESVPEGLEVLRSRYQLRLAALTRGANGSILSSAEGISERPGVAVRVVDTVGAGDAFTAAVVMGLLFGDELEELHQRAEEVASFVCTQPGATPKLPRSLMTAASISSRAQSKES